MNKQSTRNTIIEVADRLFYQQGYEYTSFSDIADFVGISRGNFYYHFKTKDEILDAVIRLRLSNTQTMLDSWEVKAEQPAERIRSFIQILIVNREKIKRYGCPIGTLCTELAKLGHSAEAEATRIFTLFRVWLRRQFQLLGHQKESDTLAMHLLARSQGIATLANAFDDENFIKQEINTLFKW